MGARSTVRVAAAAVLGGGLLLVGGALALSLASRRPVEVGLVDGRLRPCPDTPNCESSEGPEASVAPLALGDDPVGSFAALVALVRTLPDATPREARADYAHVVFRTPLLGFRDDLELRLDRELGVAHVRSASRVGRSDLGANRARIDHLRELWREARP